MKTPEVKCDICGGVVSDRGPRHERCRLRKARGAPTPPIDDRPAPLTPAQVRFNAAFNYFIATHWR